MNNEAVMVPNPMTPNQAILIDAQHYRACRPRVDVCRSDVIIPQPEKGKPPVVLYPDECWLYDCCVSHCQMGAIKITYPLRQRLGWRRKETGEYFRIGIKNPPPPNAKPPVGASSSQSCQNDYGT